MVCGSHSGRVDSQGLSLLHTDLQGDPALGICALIDLAGFSICDTKWLSALLTERTVDSEQTGAELL